MSLIPTIDLIQLANNIKAWGKSLGFQQVGISDLDLGQHSDYLQAWLDKGYHGQMDFFQRNLEKRLYPERLHPGTSRIISVRMDYLPDDAAFADNLEQPTKAFVSRYALGKDYHKLIRKRLKQLAEKITEHFTDTDYRPFVDSAPVLEHAFAEKAGIGWTGKHSLTLNREAGSWFFLGEIFINLPLPVDQPVEEGCGSCNACISICPTNAIVAPYTIDANKCISYLTIEYEGVIPEHFRTAMGNRIYGCDDCQLVCPYNKQAQLTQETGFNDLYGLKNADLLRLFYWSEEEFMQKLQGSPIRRIGIIKWRRNISIALGNAPYSEAIESALSAALDKESNDTLNQHYRWALDQQQRKKSDGADKAQVNRQQARLARTVRKGLPRDA
ncbi:tRNA epoxyqueuosine(34) reductase QueG [Glaciecola sp. 1036]|uniref:tRNA epoxyqueuosine(34) reductase QueG n=1 Tax=Alteromonadaceae TaxID=72275 RepID=UPI003D01FBA8